MSGEGAIHFTVIAIVGGDEIRAYEKQNDIGLIEMLVDGGIDLGACDDATIMPGRNESLTLRARQLGFQLIA